MIKKYYKYFAFVVLAIAVYWFLIRKEINKKIDKSTYPFMDKWSSKKIEVFRDWYVLKLPLMDESIKTLTSSEQRSLAIKRFYDGFAESVFTDEYWRVQWGKWWNMVQDAQQLDENGFKI